MTSGNNNEKLLFQLDTDPTPNIFDTVVAYDGGADHVLSYGNIKPSTVGIIIDGAIFTRPPKMKKNTALFVSGSNIADGEAVLASVRNHFFGAFRASVMLEAARTSGHNMILIKVEDVALLIEGPRPVRELLDHAARLDD